MIYEEDSFEDWFENDFSEEDDFSNLSIEPEEELEFPEPSQLRISTITATGKIVSMNNSGDIVTEDGETAINLQEMYQEIEIDEENGPFMSVEFATNPIRGFDKRKKKRKKTTKKQTKRKKFYNQSTILVKMENNNKVNVKIFKNGGVQMTGLKSIEQGIECIEKYIIPMLVYHSKSNKVVKKELCENLNTLTLIKYDIVLINSDYTTNFKVRRDQLHNILNLNYNILASFEPCIYPGVNAKYYWNEDYFDNGKPGVCMCKSKCSGKGRGKGDGKCKKVTISTFQSGSVIITGARTTRQIYDAYNFINYVFKNHFKQLRKREITIDIPVIDKSFEKTSKQKKVRKIKLIPLVL